MTFIDNKKPLETFDKIEIMNSFEITRLLKWRDNNKDLVRNFNFVLEQGIIYNKDSDVHIIFEKQGDSVYLDCLVKKDGALQHFHTILWNYKGKTVKIVHTIIKDDTQIDESNQSMITVFASLMAYMEHNIENKENVRKNTIVSNKVKKTKNGKKKSTRKISKVVYNVSVKNDEYNQTEKRQYNLSEDLSWSVKGHWRSYKNGNKVWIKPYSKGNKETKKQQATYKL